MKDRLQMMLDAIKEPCVLRLRLIKQKSPDIIMFVFEGDDDYDFYYHALSLRDFNKNFSHINGSGKDQSITLYSELIEENSEHLKNTYFFVDQDYSIFCYSCKNIITLPFYAIENPLSDEKVIKHFITSTFKFDNKSKDILESVMNYYSKAKESFYLEIRDLSINLFMSRILGLGIEFPNNEEVFDKINKDSVVLKLKGIEKVKERLLHMSADEKKYYDAICLLDKDQITRGKYVYYFVSEWLIRIKRYIHARIDSHNADIELQKSTTQEEVTLKELNATKKLKKEQYEHKDVSLSKLVPACTKIKELETFMSRMG